MRAKPWVPRPVGPPSPLRGVLGCRWALPPCRAPGFQRNGVRGCRGAQCCSAPPDPSVSHCRLTPAVGAACRREPPPAGWAPAWCSVLGKIYKKMVQKPPRSTGPLHPPYQDLPPALQHREPPGARARQPSRKPHVYLLELLGVWGGLQGVFNPLVLFLHRFSELFKLALAEQEQAGFFRLSLLLQP